MAPALRRRTLPNNAEEPRLPASVVPSRRGKRYHFSNNTLCEVFKHPSGVDETAFECYINCRGQRRADNEKVPLVYKRTLRVSDPSV
ncbi:MAG: hypothetical protein LBK25_07175 [Treponema sp.]|nr:hypothetical protein [Treponema sp.]